MRITAFLYEVHPQTICRSLKIELTVNSKGTDASDESSDIFWKRLARLARSAEPNLEESAVFCEIFERIGNVLFPFSVELHSSVKKLFTQPEQYER